MTYIIILIIEETLPEIPQLKSSYHTLSKYFEICLLSNVSLILCVMIVKTSAVDLDEWNQYYLWISGLFLLRWPTIFLLKFASKCFLIMLGWIWSSLHLFIPIKINIRFSSFSDSHTFFSQLITIQDTEYQVNS